MKKANCLWHCLFLLLPIFAYAENMVDPTRPPESQMTMKNVRSSQPLTLSAIFIYADYQLAIINGQALRTGDHINEFTITAIRPFTVELMRSSGNKEILSLVPAVKQRSQHGW